MKDLVKKQFEKVQVADLSNFNEEGAFIIPKYNKDRFEVGKYYLIELDRSLIVNNPNNLIQVNWNNNTFPQFQYLKVDVCKVMGKMIKVNSIAYDIQCGRDIDIMWSGWLPNDLIKIVNKL